MASWEGDAHFGGTRIKLFPNGTYICSGIYETNTFKEQMNVEIDYRGKYRSERIGRQVKLIFQTDDSSLK